LTAISRVRPIRGDIPSDDPHEADFRRHSPTRPGVLETRVDRLQVAGVVAVVDATAVADSAAEVVLMESFERRFVDLVSPGR
jgi:hypothetical protein